jgi:hypothetical protein
LVKQEDKLRSLNIMSEKELTKAYD